MTPCSRASRSSRYTRCISGFAIEAISDQLRDYFHRYESAQTHINAILNALYRGQDELRKDNAALEQEKVHLWETMQRLTQYVYVAQHLDSSLTARIAEIEASDPERAKALKDDVLFYVRQKRQEEQHRADQGR